MDMTVSMVKAVGQVASMVKAANTANHELLAASMLNQEVPAVSMVMEENLLKAEDNLAPTTKIIVNMEVVIKAVIV